MMPNGLDSPFDFFPWCKVEDDRAEVHIRWSHLQLSVQQYDCPGV